MVINLLVLLVVLALGAIATRLMAKNVCFFLKVLLVFQEILYLVFAIELPLLLHLLVQDRHHLLLAHFLPDFLLLLGSDPDLQLVVGFVLVQPRVP